MYDETSIQRQLHRESTFIPPYCPNPKCIHHGLKEKPVKFWKKDGGKKLKRFPYRAQRFKCLACGATFGPSRFSLHYRTKVWGYNELIFEYLHAGASICKTARKIHHSERLVRTRLRNMARWAETKNAYLQANLKITEPVVYDGLQNFSYSQFDPNWINHVVGKDSLFTYDFNVTIFNRKGRVSPRQKRKKKQLENKHGPYAKNGIRTATARLISRILKRTEGTLILHSDRHYDYERAFKIDLKGCDMMHIQTSSKLYRNFNNPLFAVNNVDDQARQTIAAFQRETIAFNKHEVAMQDTFMLYTAYRNYMRPMYWEPNKIQPECATTSPAMKLGITDRIFSYSDFFGERVFPTQVRLNEDAKARFERLEPTSRRNIADALRY